MAQIYGQLESAQLENKTSDYSATASGRVWFRTDTLVAKIANGSDVRQFLINDGNAIIGNNGTANNNIRFHRGAAGVLQFVTGGDSTAEGTLSTSLNQISFRAENYTTAARPTFGNAGRFIWNTTTGSFQGDTGSAWIDASVGTNTVLDANLRQSAGLSVIGRSANTTGNVADITAANDYEIIQRVGTAIAFGPYKKKYRSVTTTDSPTTADDILNLSGASFTVTIPTAVGNTGKVLTLIHAGTSLSQVYTLNTTSGQTIGGLASGVYKLTTNGEKLEIYSDGTNWQIKNHVTDTDWVDTSEPLVGFYTFTISAGNATIGATYTNNGNTYTVAKTVAAGSTVVMTGPAAPAASGTLTKTTGTGDATLTFSTFSGSAYRISGTTTAPTFYGTPIINKMIWRRSGKFVTVKVSHQWTVAGLGGTGDYLFPMPLNITIDTTYYPLYTGGNISAQNSQTSANIINMQSNVLGRVAIDSGGQFTATQSAPYTSTSYRIWGQYNGSDGAFPIGSNYCTVANAVACYIWEVTFPVSGWQP